MLDYQRIVDDVRGALLNNADAGDDFLQAAASDYFLAVDGANQRLGACGGLLRKGLRSEAIQLCEVEPNLLDVVQTLDFPEGQSWRELLALHGMAAPSALLLDVAADLNQAYAIEQPLTKLLLWHRLLALGRGPLKRRVEVLRSLAAADPDNPVWDQDLRTFEIERIKELQKEVPQAIFKADRSALAALSAELEISAWRVRPDALIQQIAAARSHDARERGLAELQSTAEQLHARHAEMDIEGGRAVRAKWNQLFAAWGQFANPAVLAGIGGALDWLRQQDEIDAQAARHKQAVQQLMDAAIAGKPANDLHGLYSEARRESEVPQAVEKRYHEAIAAHDRAARRRVRISLAIFAGFVAVTASVIAAVVWMQMRAAQVDRDVTTVQQLFDDGNFDKAQSFIDQLTAQSPRSAADPRVQEVVSKLAKQSRDENERRTAFARQMGYLLGSIADKVPDRGALENAKKLAKTDEDVAAVRKAERECEAIEKAVQSKADQDFLAQVKELRQRVDEIERGDESPDASIDKLAHVTQELTKLLSGGTRVSGAAKQPAEALTARIQTLNDEARTAGERLNREEAVTAALGDNEAFRTALSAYAEKSPHARRSASFREVAERDSPLWAWVAEWNGMVDAMGRRNCAGLGKDGSSQMAARLRKLLEERGGHPDADIFRKRLPYLDAMVHRADSDGKAIAAALKPIFTDPLVAGAWMLKDGDGKRYYLLEDPAEKFGEIAFLNPTASYGFDYVTGFDLAKKNKSLHGSDIKGTDPVAPQRKTGKALAAALESLGDENWEASFCRMIETVVKDGDTDPLLKHFLLRKVLDVACKGSLCMENGFRECRDALANSPVPAAVNWVDPNNAEAKEQRPRAADDLDVLKRGFAAAQAETAKQWKALAANIGSQYTSIGWLRKDAAGNWQCVTRPNCGASGKLVVVRADEQNTRIAIFDPIGRIDDGKTSLAAANGPALAEGRPVYVIVPPR